MTIKTHVVALAIITTSLLGVSPASAVPGTMGFSARIADASGPVDGSVSIEVKIWDALSGGAEQWSETHSTTASDGVVHVQLGGSTPLAGTFDGSDRYLELWIEGERQEPRVKIGSVPYSVAAGTAERLGTLEPSDVALAGHGHSFSDITGSLGTGQYSCIDDLTAEGFLDGANPGDLVTRSQGDTRYRNASNMNAGTLPTDRYSAYADLNAEGRLDGSVSGDLQTRSVADGRYVRRSHVTTSHFSISSSAPGGGSSSTSTSNWEICALSYTNIAWGGYCDVFKSGTTWTLTARNHNIGGSAASCSMYCLNLM